MISDPFFYLTAIPAVLIAGISKGGFGGGLGVVAVPLISLFISPTQAAAIMLPILCFMDLFGSWSYRKNWSAANLKILLPAAILGIGIGTVTFQFLNDSFILLILGTIAIAFTLNYWFGKKVIEPSLPKPSSGGFWGMVAGFTSFVAHAGGPPLSVVLLPQRLNKTVFVGTTVIFFTVVNYIKLIPYTWLGQFQYENLMSSLVLLPCAFIGIKLGIWLHSRVNEVLFYRACFILLFLTGLKLTYDGVSGF